MVAPGDELVELQLLARNKRLRQTRKEKHLTQEDLFRITGIPINTIRRIENLWFVPSREMMEEIACALEKPVSFLFPQELTEAIEEGVFHERRVQLDTQRITSFTGAKRLGRQLSLTSGTEEAEREIDQSLLKNQIKEVLAILSSVQQEVITLRFGLDGGGKRTLDEVGQEFRVGRERIRQIEAKALKRLRHPSQSRKLKGFLAD